MLYSKQTIILFKNKEKLIVNRITFPCCLSAFNNERIFIFKAKTPFLYVYYIIYMTGVLQY